LTSRMEERTGLIKQSVRIFSVFSVPIWEVLGLEICSGSFLLLRHISKPIFLPQREMLTPEVYCRFGGWYSFFRIMIKV